MAKVDVKTVKVRYSYFSGQPKNKQVARRIAEMEEKGWRLQNRHEYKAGCLILVGGIGHTELTFVREKR